MRKIEEIFKSYAEKTTAPLGLGFMNLKTGESEYFNENQCMPTASVYKIYLLMDIFYRVQRGQLSLKTLLTLVPKIKTVGTGILYEMDNERKYSVHDLSVLMMALSDNTAADLLGSFLTLPAVHAEILKPLQLTHTCVQVSCKEMIEEMYQAPVGQNESNEEYFRLHQPKQIEMDVFRGNYTTAGDMVRALEVIVQGNFFTDESRKRILKMLSLCQNDTRIPRKLPSSVKTAHKTGSLDRISNDAGIVYGEEAEYILVMFYNGNKASRHEYEANQGRKFSDALLADLSKDIYDCVKNGG